MLESQADSGILCFKINKKPDSCKTGVGLKKSCATMRCVCILMFHSKFWCVFQCIVTTKMNKHI
jgi:hypothetical protein